MIHYDFEYNGFKVRTHRQSMGCAYSDTDELWFRTTAWDKHGNTYRGETMPNRAEAQQDAINWIEFVTQGDEI